MKQSIYRLLVVLLVFLLVACSMPVSLDKAYYPVEVVYLDGKKKPPVNTSLPLIFKKNKEGRIAIYDSDGTEEYADFNVMGVTLSFKYSRNGNKIKYEAPTGSWAEYQFVDPKTVYVFDSGMKKDNNVDYIVFKLKE